MSASAKMHKEASPEKLNFAIITVSTSRYEQPDEGSNVEDVSGDLIESFVTNAGHSVLFRKVVRDDRNMIEDEVRHVLSISRLDAAIFCGGTGITHSDVTIETIAPLLEKALTGFGEIFRHLSYEKIGSAAILSRTLAGVARGKVIFCIPGSPDAVSLCVERLILPETAHIVKHARE